MIIFSNRFASYLAKAATGELPLGLVFKMVGLYAPELLSYLVPLGLFMAMLFAFGRFYADNEMVVLAACGIKYRYIIQLALSFSIVVMLLMMLLTLGVIPKTTVLREQALSERESFGGMQSMLPQRFQMFAGGEFVFYLEDVFVKENNLKGIFIAERPINIGNTEEPWTLITAENAHFKQDEKTNQSYIVLKDGYRYEGLPGTADYKVVHFKEYGRAISDKKENTDIDAVRLKNTAELLSKGHTAEDAAELQWRLSFPLSIPILALIAVPLAHVRPRQGRFAKFVPAIAIYIIYYNLITVSKRWIIAGVLPEFIGIWWVHGLFFLAGLGLIAKDSGWYRRFKART